MERALEMRLAYTKTVSLLIASLLIFIPIILGNLVAYSLKIFIK